MLEDLSRYSFYEGQALMYVGHVLEDLPMYVGHVYERSRRARALSLALARSRALSMSFIGMVRGIECVLLV